MLYPDTMENVENIFPLTTSFISCLVLWEGQQVCSEQGQPDASAILLRGLIYNENILSGFIHCGKHLVIVIMTSFSATLLWIPQRNGFINIKTKYRSCAVGGLAVTASQVELLCANPTDDPAVSIKSLALRTLPADLEAGALCSLSCTLCLSSSNSCLHLWGVCLESAKWAQSCFLWLECLRRWVSYSHCIEIACFLPDCCMF